MKTFAGQIAHFLRKDTSRRNLRVLARLLAVLAVIVVVSAFAFHLLMLREGREFSWFTGIYWTLTTMSTLGFGDITFESDIGRIFTMCVLLTGTIYMLILLPFSFIRFFYAPWMEAQSEARAAPRAGGHPGARAADQPRRRLHHADPAARAVQLPVSPARPEPGRRATPARLGLQGGHGRAG